MSRTVDRAVLKQGPSYFADLLNWPAGYKGPYKSPKNADISSAIETPDDTTIVFHLKQPFAEFDYLASLPTTAPVPAAKDTGAKYTTHPISSGPYMWKGNVDVATGGTLVRNPNWDASTDPNRKALPDQIDVKLGLQADDLDNQIISGDQDVDIAGTGVQPAALPKVLQSKELLGPRGQPGHRARVVHPDHRHREAAGQHRLPQGRHLRDEPDVVPERLRRQVRRRRDRDAPCCLRRSRATRTSTSTA